MLAICGLSGLGLLISPSWRMLIVLLAVQYLAAFWLINQQWPVSLAAVADRGLDGGNHAQHRPS